MTSSNVRKAILGGLIAVLAAWYVLPRWLGRPAPAPAEAAERAEVPATTELAPPVDSYAKAQAQLREQRRTAAIAWPTDPFGVTVERPAGSAPQADESSPGPGAPPAYVLKGVITGTPPRALLNDLVVAVGDELAEGATVLAIDADSLTIQSPRGRIVVTLAE